MIDLIDREAIYFDGDNGEDVRREPIPADLVDAAERARQGMLEALSMLSDEIMELLLEEAEVPLDLIHKTIREGTIAQQLCPVMVGSAYRNKGVQPLLDAVQPLPAQPAGPRGLRQGPQQRRGRDAAGRRTPTHRSWPWRSSWSRSRSARSPSCGSTRERWPRVTSTSTRGSGSGHGSAGSSASTPTRKKTSTRPRAGDIVAVMGLECATGDTYCSEGTDLSLESIYAAEPVIDLSIQPAKRADYDKLAKALNRFMREDPTFRVHVDHETSETIISGMGELHLEIYVERIRREYKVECTVGAPKVSYREAPDQGNAVQLQAQEADRRLRPVRPRRGQADPARPAGARAVRLREQGHRRPDPDASTSPRSRRASANRCTRGPSPATRSSACTCGSKTARTTTSTRRPWPSRSAPATASARRSRRPIRSCSSRS